MSSKARMPSRVVHCDWGASSKKRWMATASIAGDSFVASAPTVVGDTVNLLSRLRHDLADDDRLLVGFDFPIGIPSAFARKTSVTDFLSFLRSLEDERGTGFFEKCRTPQEVSLERPFYPKSCRTKGAATRQHLTTGLGLAWQDLYRQCERATSTRGSACPLFWTLGGSQVGTAAINGWREVLVPAVGCSLHLVGIWPFGGDLGWLLEHRKTVIAETYPAEAYAHLGFPLKWNGKRRQERRRDRADNLQNWASDRGVQCDEKLIEDILDGFGAATDGEDRFDAVVGLFGMLDVVLGYRSATVPNNPVVTSVEGWILGQQ